MNVTTHVIPRRVSTLVSFLSVLHIHSGRGYYLEGLVEPDIVNLPVMQIVNRLTELGTADAKLNNSMLTEAPWRDHDVSTLKTVEISGHGGK